jgi:hypothetical protein
MAARCVKICAARSPLSNVAVAVAVMRTVCGWTTAFMLDSLGFPKGRVSIPVAIGLEVDSERRLDVRAGHMTTQ